MNSHSKRHIAIVEDEPAVLDNTRAALERQGYRVSGYKDLPSARRAMRQQLPDLAIIDIGLQDEPEGGFELCQFLRQQSPTLPIILFSARDSEIDVVSGLRLGADDYLSKDISLPHLLARVAALFRRQEAFGQAAEAGQVIAHGELKLLTENLQMFWRDQPVELTVTEFWMVVSLARHPGHVKSRAQLMEDASIFVDEATVTSHIKRIRRKIQAIDAEFDAIDTVHGLGYRWKPATA
jgi:two-component system OmpR family response regulator